MFQNYFWNYWWNSCGNLVKSPESAINWYELKIRFASQSQFVNFWWPHVRQQRSLSYETTNQNHGNVDCKQNYKHGNERWHPSGLGLSWSCKKSYTYFKLGFEWVPSSSFDIPDFLQLPPLFTLDTLLVFLDTLMKHRTREEFLIVYTPKLTISTLA